MKVSITVAVLACARIAAAETALDGAARAGADIALVSDRTEGHGAFADAELGVRLADTVTLSGFSSVGYISSAGADPDSFCDVNGQSGPEVKYDYRYWLVTAGARITFRAGRARFGFGGGIQEEHGAGTTNCDNVFHDAWFKVEPLVETHVAVRLHRSGLEAFIATSFVGELDGYVRISTRVGLGVEL